MKYYDRSQMLPNLGLSRVNMETFHYQDSRGEGRGGGVLNVNEGPD